MTTRLALLDLIAQQRLDAEQAGRLWRLAGLDRPPSRLLTHMRRGLMLVGAGCGGLGLVFWVAANWGLLTRFQQFALLQSLAFVPGAVAAAIGRGRAVPGLLALLATGGLFAYLGQTYQTGADPWQLFAVWAALALPLALCARTDAVWGAWVIVALTGIVLWQGAHTPWWFTYSPGDELFRIGALVCSVALTLAVSRLGQRYTGAGPWAFGIALVLTAAWMTAVAITSLWGDLSGHGPYWFGLLLAGLAAAVLAAAKPFDVFAASVVALGLNVMMVFGIGTVLESAHANGAVGLLVIGVSAMVLLAGTVHIILGLQRTGKQGETA